MRNKPENIEQVLKRYPALTAHLISQSLGYALPTTAGNIILDAIHKRENWCEWIYSCYNRDPLPAVQDAIRQRRTHNGYMAEFKYALALVKRAVETGQEPLFASWF